MKNLKSLLFVSAFTMISSMNVMANEVSYSTQVSTTATVMGLENGVFFFINLSKNGPEFALMNYYDYDFLGSNGGGQQNTDNPISGNRSFTTYNVAQIPGTTIGLVYTPTHLASASSTAVLRHRKADVIVELEHYESTGEVSETFSAMIEGTRESLGSAEMTDEAIIELFYSVVAL